MNVAADGTLSGTPGVPDIGTTPYTVRVDDGMGNFDTETLNIEVIAANVPHWVVDPTVKTDGFATYAYSDTIIDPDDVFDPEGDTLTFSKTGGPGWLNVAGGGALTGTPPVADGLNIFTIEADDGNGNTSSVTLHITVNAGGRIYDP